MAFVLAFSRNSHISGHVYHHIVSSSYFETNLFKFNQIQKNSDDILGKFQIYEFLFNIEMANFDVIINKIFINIVTF